MLGSRFWSFRPLINTLLERATNAGRGGSASQLILMSQSLILSSDSSETDTDISNSPPSAIQSGMFPNFLEKRVTSSPAKLSI